MVKDFKNSQLQYETENSNDYHHSAETESYRPVADKQPSPSFIFASTAPEYDIIDVDAEYEQNTKPDHGNQSHVEHPKRTTE